MCGLIGQVVTDKLQLLGDRDKERWYLGCRIGWWKARLLVRTVGGGDTELGGIGHEMWLSFGRGSWSTPRRGNC